MGSDLNKPSLTTWEFWDLVDQRVRRGLRGLARPVRGVLVKVDGSLPALAARLQARASEDLSNLEIAQHFGFASAPPANVEAFAIHVGGAPEHPVVVAELDRSGARPSLELGEAAIYSSTGAKVTCKQDGSVELESVGQAKVTLGADGSVLLESVAGGTIEITALGIVKLNGGTQPVARVGDTAAVSGSSATINSGNLTVLA